MSGENTDRQVVAQLSEMSNPIDVANRYCYFFDDAEFVATDRPGFRRRVITGEGLQLWFWRIAGGSTGSYLHRHDDHEQLGVVVRGQLDFRIGDSSDDRRVVLGAGDLYLAPKSVWHGDSIFIGDEEFGECWILDMFAPPRTDIGSTPEAAQVRTTSNGDIT